MKKSLIVGIILLVFVFFVYFNSSQERYENISINTLDNFIEEHPDYIYIDVRTAEEYELNHIDKFININSSIAASQIEKNYSKDENIVLICRSGNRSSKVANQLIELGFHNIYNVEF